MLEVRQYLTLVMLVQFKNTDQTYVPALQWAEGDLDMYRANVGKARKAYWQYFVEEANVNREVDACEEAMKTAGIPTARRKQMMMVVQQEKRELVGKYYAAERVHITEEYLSQSAEDIKDTTYKPLLADHAAFDGIDFETRAVELQGFRRVPCQLRVGRGKGKTGKTLPLTHALWSGPFCSAKKKKADGSEGKMVGHFGVPREIELINPDTVDDDEPECLFRISSLGWDLAKGEIKTGTSAAVTVADQYEGETSFEILEWFQAKYCGKMTYSDGREYVGLWSNGMKHGFGTMTSPDGSQITGEWLEDRSPEEVAKGQCTTELILVFVGPIAPLYAHTSLHHV
jgi:hypothetical protein